jgi:hypothetical protein
LIAFADGLGFSTDQERKSRAEFCDYWRGVPGSRGCKLDWPATYRNRLREVAGKLKLQPRGNVLPFASGTDPPRHVMTEAEKRAAALKFDEDYRAGKYR